MALTGNVQAVFPAELLQDVAKSLQSMPGTFKGDYEKSFTGELAQKYLIKEGFAGDEVGAQLLGNMLLNAKVIRYTSIKTAGFQLGGTYSLDETAPAGSGDDVHAYDFLRSGWDQKEDRPADAAFEAPGTAEEKEQVDAFKVPLEDFELKPMDELNSKLLDAVHPVKFENPKVEEAYDMVVIGAGAGGLVTASGCSRHGAKTALIEYNLLGGDCLNVGCVPSKALLSAAKLAAHFKKAGKYGLTNNGEVTVDFAAVMKRLRAQRLQIAPNDSVQRFRDSLGVDVYFGHARFTSANTVQVGDRTLKFKKATIATGAAAFVPPIPGVESVKYHTNATIFNLEELPKRMAVVGGGPIGSELSQAFARFGTQVTMLDHAPKILWREDKEAAAVVQNALTEDGVQFELGVGVDGLKQEGNEIHVSFSRSGEKKTLVVDCLLFATGRKPNVTGLGLEHVGVKYSTRTGIEINDFLQTANPNIYAVGDATSKYQFTHVAGAMGGICWKNALFGGTGRFSKLQVPWVTYTEPEVAHVGKYEHELAAEGAEYKVYKKEFADVDRSIVDSDTVGFVKIVCRAGSDEILGGTIVASKAGELLGEVSVAMLSKTGLGQLGAMVHPYPTASEAIAACGWAYGGTHVTKFIKDIVMHSAEEYRKEL